MRRQSTVAVAALATSLLLTSAATSPLLATEAIGRTKNLECTVCHDKPGSKLLTDQGKYFEVVGSLQGFEELRLNFGECTVCHAAKPGSQKLTKAGKQFQRAFADMADLRAFVMKEHPELVPLAPAPPPQP